MRNKKFSLSGILKLREYEEARAMQEFIRKTQRDRQLAGTQESLGMEMQASRNQIQGGNIDVEKLRSVYKHMGTCQNKKVHIVAEREKLTESVAAAQEEYNEVRRAFESIKILNKKHSAEQKKRKTAQFYEELQENNIWLNK